MLFLLKKRKFLSEGPLNPNIYPMHFAAFILYVKSCSTWIPNEMALKLIWSIYLFVQRDTLNKWRQS